MNATECQKWTLTKPEEKLSIEVGNKRNYQLRLETSIVSISMTSSFLKPDKAKSFSNSQPKPPAPTTKTLTYSCRSSLNCNRKPRKTLTLIRKQFII